MIGQLYDEFMKKLDAEQSVIRSSNITNHLTNKNVGKK